MGTVDGRRRRSADDDAAPTDADKDTAPPPRTEERLLSRCTDPIIESSPRRRTEELAGQGKRGGAAGRDPSADGLWAGWDGSAEAESLDASLRLVSRRVSDGVTAGSADARTTSRIKERGSTAE